MLIYTDIVSGKDVCTDSYPIKLIADGAIMEVESKKVQVGGEAIDIGANASAEEAEEKLDDEVKTVINIIEAHNLQKVENLELKDFKTMQTQYWKDLLAGINAKRHEILFPDSTPPTDKEELKKAEAAAEKKLNAYDKTRYEQLQTQFANYKKHFKALQDFVKDEVVKNYKDFDFYLPAEPAQMGKCMIIPARYIGEATAPVFYFYAPGLLEEKA